MRKRHSPTFVLSVALALVIGAALLAVSSAWAALDNYPIVRAILRDFGSLFFVGTAGTLLWEMFGKEEFLGDIQQRTRLAQSVMESGVREIVPFQQIAWPDLLLGTKNLDLMFAYGATWFNSHRAELAAVAADRNAKVRLLLPNPDSEWLVQTLSKRFDYTVEEVKKRIDDAVKAFKKMFESPDSRASLEIYFHEIDLVHTAYLFDRGGVFAPYALRGKVSELPALVVLPSGAVHAFLSKDFEFLLSHPATKRVHPD